MAHLLSLPTVVLDTTNLHTHPMQGRRRCMATPHTSHNTPIMAATPSSRMALSINLKLASILTGRLSLLACLRAVDHLEEGKAAVVGAVILPICLGLPVKAQKVATSCSLEKSLGRRETMRRNLRLHRVNSLLHQATTTTPLGRLPI